MEHNLNTITGAVTQSQVGGQNDQAAEEQEQIDFKMVTFSLGGKDYAVDIMNVKEIAKFTHFTFVPNTLPFVRGVYNLRGEIISIIDFRQMFNLPSHQKSELEAEDGLILRLEDNTLGVVVDKIDRVVGISSANIQPPHPIFADINLSYINGVVEFEGRLYIILDVERIFSKDSDTDKTGVEQAASVAHGASAGESTALSASRSAGEPAGTANRTAPAPVAAPEAAEEDTTASASGSEQDVTFDFIAEGLATFRVMYVSDINRTWVQRRFAEWKKERTAQGADVQFQTEEEAQAFVRPFYSPFTATFWADEYANAVDAVLPHIRGNLVHAWNPGCGKGFESYCLAVILRRHYPDKQIKIWAGDKDLLSISTAPNLVFPIEEVPDYYKEYVVEGTNGYSFSSEIKDMILFEYHDVLNPNNIPEVAVVLSRDLLSFLETGSQGQVVDQMKEKLAPNGVIIAGANEDLSWDPDLESRGGQAGRLSVYGKA